MRMVIIIYLQDDISPLSPPLQRGSTNYQTIQNSLSLLDSRLRENDEFFTSDATEIQLLSVIPVETGI